MGLQEMEEKYTEETLAFICQLYEGNPVYNDKRLYLLVSGWRHTGSVVAHSFNGRCVMNEQVW